MDELHIPPAVTFHFEKIIALVAEHAQLEPTEWAIRSHELMGQLEHRWREGIDMGLSTDAAERRALELFGDPGAVGRRFKKRWEVNLLFSYGWRVARIVLFLISMHLAVTAVQVSALSAKATKEGINTVNSLNKSLDDSKRRMAEIKKSLPKRSSHPDTTSKLPQNAEKASSAKADYREYEFTTYDQIAIAMDNNIGWISLSQWLAIAAPFLISFVTTRTKRSRFGSPLAIALMVPVMVSALFVAIVPLSYVIHGYAYKFTISSLPGDAIYTAFCGLGALCVLSDALDFPAKRKWRLLKLLGYRNPA
ncbi:MAG: hypothetical protein WCS99_17360 [Limisphaerales bacterium]